MLHQEGVWKEWSVAWRWSEGDFVAESLKESWVIDGESGLKLSSRWIFEVSECHKSRNGVTRLALNSQLIRRLARTHSNPPKASRAKRLESRIRDPSSDSIASYTHSSSFDSFFALVDWFGSKTSSGHVVRF